MKLLIEQACDVTDDALDYVRAERKWWAQRDNDPALDKKERKEARQWIKVCTIVLENMYGTVGGKEDGILIAKLAPFPIELEDKIRYVYIQSFGNQTPYSEIMKRAQLNS